jgi:hypothetical protein
MFAFWQNKKKPGGGAGLLKVVLAHREREESPKLEHAKDSRFEIKRPFIIRVNCLAMVRKTASMAGFLSSTRLVARSRC